MVVFKKIKSPDSPPSVDGWRIIGAIVLALSSSITLTVNEANVLAVCDRDWNRDETRLEAEEFAVETDDPSDHAVATR